MGIIVDRSQYDPKLFVYPGAFEPRGESAVSDQIALAMLPADRIAAIRPPLPPIPPPDLPKFDPPTVTDIVGVPRGRDWGATGPRGKPSPPPLPAGYGLEGSPRGAMGSVSPFG